ncbi:MAG: Rieske (2Fe-2S) protein [Haloarculaceae archaeon]
MDEDSRMTDVAAIPEDDTLLVALRDVNAASEVEAILLRAGDEVACWLNYCQHWTDVRLDRGEGGMRNGEIVCKKHGATFQPDTGHCDFGPCEGAYLNDVDVTVADGGVYLTDPDYAFDHVGAVETDPLEQSTNPGERLGF